MSRTNRVSDSSLGRATTDCSIGSGLRLAARCRRVIGGDGRPRHGRGPRTPGEDGNEVGFYQSFVWRRASYRTMPAAVARLRLRTAPVGIGMPIVRAAYRSRTVAGSPFDSL